MSTLAAAGARCVAMRNKLRAWAPGALVCAVVALASTFISEHLGGPQLLYALLLGICLNFLSEDPRVRAGIDVCGRSILRVGVALLGARITAEQIGQLGWPVALIVLLGVASTIALGVAMARWLKRPVEEGLISGGAVGICGASAAMAVASVLPPNKDNERFTLLTVVGVTLFSTIAMVLYPLMTTSLGWETVDAGVFLGATIHDVAQVVASATMLTGAVGPQAVDAATVVKLFRVMLLMPVVILIALAIRRHQGSSEEQAAPMLPGFLLAFIVLVLLNSTQMIPQEWSAHATSLSRACLVLAIAAAGLKTHPRDLLKLGWIPVAMLGTETLWLALLVALTKGVWT